MGGAVGKPWLHPAWMPVGMGGMWRWGCGGGTGGARCCPSSHRELGGIWGSLQLGIVVLWGQWGGRGVPMAAPWLDAHRDRGRCGDGAVGVALGDPMAAPFWGGGVEWYLQPWEAAGGGHSVGAVGWVVRGTPVHLQVLSQVLAGILQLVLIQDDIKQLLGRGDVLGWGGYGARDRAGGGGGPMGVPRVGGLTGGHCTSLSAAIICTLRCFTCDLPRDLMSRWRTYGWGGGG